MKKIASIVALLTLSFSFAQKDFQGMAVYESKTNTADIMKNMDGNPNITPEMRTQIQERMRKAFEKTYILNFDRTSSIYKEEEKLEAGNTQGRGGMRFMTSMMGGGGTFFKSVKDQTFTVDKEFMGKEFLVVDSLPKLNWVLTEETKQIGDYTCFKATAVKEAPATDFRNFRMRGGADAAKKEEEKKTEEKEKKTNLLDSMGDMPKEITVTAWYCPEIPINNGPENYWGLPGLILEVNDGKTIIMCSKIAMNIKEKAEIKAPKNGSKVTQKEYDEIVKKKMEEMAQQGFGPGGGRGTMQVRMGR
jgi:GLPGLI family protein